MYLIDTVALSELRKRERDPGMVRWLRNKSADSLFLSVVTIGEIEWGIFRQTRVNPVFAEALGAWLDRTVDIYGDRSSRAMSGILFRREFQSRIRSKIWADLVSGKIGQGDALARRHFAPRLVRSV